MNAGSILTGDPAVAHIKRLADQTESMAHSISGISANVYSKNARGDKFPGHIHSFVRSMMCKHRNVGARPQQHYFSVFNPSTTWWPKFDDIDRADPLGDRFLGYSHDLDELVTFLVDEARPRLGPDPIIHILIPTIGHLAVTESLTFPAALGPFCVTGQLAEGGLPLVYLCMPRRSDRRHLHHVGHLSPKPRWVLLQQLGLPLPVVGKWLSAGLEHIFFEDPSFKVTTTSSLFLHHAAYFEVNPVPPRTLGPVARRGD